MDESEQAAARAALQRVLPELAPSEIAGARLAALRGGIRRRSWLVTLESGRSVLRMPTPGGEGLLGIATEALVTMAAARAGLAPAVLAVDAAAGVLLTEYRAGAVPWTATVARRSMSIERAAPLLRALHTVSIELPEFAAEHIARGYLADLGRHGPGAPLPGDSDASGWADELLQLARRYDSTYAPTALCHNDLVAANVLDDGELTLVDFEYAVRAAPILDLAGLAGMNDYGAAQQRELLDAYYHAAVPTLGEFAGIVRMVRLLAWFWARRGARRAADAAPYTQLAARLGETLK